MRNDRGGNGRNSSTFILIDLNAVQVVKEISRIAKWRKIRI
jgi:hypothetical protein